MKKIIVFLWLLLTSLTGFSQGISLSGLISVYNKDQESADIFLSSKGWELHKVEEDGTENIISWAYNKRLGAPIPEFDDNGSMKPSGPKYEAQGWLYVHTGDKSLKEVQYSPSSKKYFDSIRNQAIALKMKRIKYSSENGRIVSTYTGKNYSVTFITRVANEDMISENGYSILLSRR